MATTPRFVGSPRAIITSVRLMVGVAPVFWVAPVWLWREQDVEKAVANKSETATSLRLILAWLRGRITMTPSLATQLTRALPSTAAAAREQVACRGNGTIQ